MRNYYSTNSGLILAIHQTLLIRSEFPVLVSLSRVYGFGGLERWNGMVDWTGLEWNGMEWPDIRSIMVGVSDL